jgi:hypothetical protein
MGMSEGLSSPAESRSHKFSRQGQARYRISMPWLVWLVVSLCLTAYALTGVVASQSTFAEVKLTPGYAVELNVLRIAQDRLRMSLDFEGSRSERPELGTWQSAENSTRVGYLKFQNPGASIRILASIENASPVIYEALPASAYGGSVTSRDLTSNLSIEKGLWRWSSSPTSTQLLLPAGISKLRLEVLAVDAPLTGEPAHLTIQPLLGFKSGMLNVAWLWWSFAWPILAFVQVFWAILIFVFSRRKRVSDIGTQPGG